MKFKPIRFILVFAIVIAIGSFLKPMHVAADTPDVLENYTISITPQQDGTLVMNYVLKNYCTYSNWPTDQPYLQVGVPNENFTITDFGPKEMVVNAEPVSGKFVQLDFDQSKLPGANDCFDLNFTITQANMARTDPTNGNATFEFYPAGWNFEINVKHLTVIWALPTDPTLIKVTDPAPTSKDATSFTWTWDDPQMDQAQMFTDATVKIAYDKSAFTLPVAPPPAPQQQTGNGNAATNDNGGGPDPFTILLIGIGIIVVAVFVIGRIGALIGGSSGDDSLGSDSGFDASDNDPPVVYTAHSRSSSHESSESNSEPSYHESPHYDPPSTSGGGFGGSSGLSSGCASMPACACACACAGGGKVGCMLKTLGVKIGCLQKVVKEITAKPAP